MGRAASVHHLIVLAAACVSAADALRAFPPHPRPLAAFAPPLTPGAPQQTASSHRVAMSPKPRRRRRRPNSSALRASDSSDGGSDGDRAEGDGPVAASVTAKKRRKKKKKQRKDRPARWIACASTRELARAVRLYVREGDAVAELGSQLRDASRAVCDAIGPDGRAVLADVSRKWPSRADSDEGAGRTSAMRREEDEEEFERMYGDRAEFVELGEEGGFDAWRSALFFRDGPVSPSFDVLVVDVAVVMGNDLDLTSISLVRDFLALNDAAGGVAEDEYIENGGGHESSFENDGRTRRRKCRLVIVKSSGLHSWARRLVHAQRLAAGTAPEHIQGRLSEDASGGVEAAPAPPVIIAAVGVSEYRRAAPFAVRPGDAVLEVGCHVGKTTALLHEMARPDGSDIGGCLGIDIGPKIVKAARKRYPDVPFAVADAWRTGDLLRLKGQLSILDSAVNEDGRCWGYDIVYVDIGGISGSDGLLEAVSLLTALGNALEPRCIVIKSRCVRHLASCLTPFSEIWLQLKREEAAQ